MRVKLRNRRSSQAHDLSRILVHGYMEGLEKRNRTSWSRGRRVCLRVVDGIYNTSVLLGILAGSVGGLAVAGTAIAAVTRAPELFKPLGALGLGSLGAGAACWGSVKLMIVLERHLMKSAPETPAAR